MDDIIQKSHNKKKAKENIKEKSKNTENILLAMQIYRERYPARLHEVFMW